MTVQKIKTSQTRQHTVLPMIGNAADESGDSVLSKIDSQLSKLFEDRNILLVGGGVIAVNSGTTSVTFTANLRLHVNSLVAGGSPKNIDLASTTRAFTSDGNMLYAVIDRSAGTATVTADASTLPSVVAANQEVVLIAKRVGTSIYFRNGISITASSSRTFDNTSLGLGSLNVSSLYQEGASNDTASGSNVTLTAPTTPIVRLTAGGTLISIDMIPAGVSGQIIKVINATGSAVNVNNELGATPANQILTGTSGTLSLANNASILLVYDGTSSRWRILGGSGSGSGGGSAPNYILSPSADTGAAGWTTYADAAATSPVDGTGGSPNVTFTTTTSSPLRGSSSFLFTKDAVNRQGQGFSYDFTIDNSDKGKVLQGFFEYQIASGTFADNDISVWIYDITNAVLIQPAPYLIKNSTLIEKFGFEFQTSINSTSYRLIFHVASTSASAYTIKMDTFNVGPQEKLYGSPIADLISYTPTLNGVGTATNVSFKYGRRGDHLIVIGSFTTGTVAGSLFSITLPSGLTIDSTKIPLQNTTSNPGQKVGTYQQPASGGNGFIVTAVGSSALLVYSGNGNTAATMITPQNGSTSFISTTQTDIEFSVPILGWSSSQVISSDADTRVVAASYANVSNQSIPDNTSTIINYAILGFDTHAAVTTGASWKYTAPVPGLYRVNVSTLFDLTTTWIDTETFTLELYKNNVSQGLIEYKQSFGSASNIRASGKANKLVSLIAGDFIDVRIIQTSGAALTLNASMNYIDIERLTGPSQIMASESVSALYTGAPPTGTINASFNIATYGTKVKDSHNSYSSGSYTVPSSGVYSIKAQARYSGTHALGQNNSIAIFVNGVQKHSGVIQSAGAVAFQIPQVSVHSLPLLAGDIITIRTATDAGSPSYGSSADQNFFSIIRTGNY